MTTATVIEQVRTTRVERDDFIDTMPVQAPTIEPEHDSQDWDERFLGITAYS